MSTPYTERNVGRWEWRDNHYVFRRYTEKFMESLGAHKLKDHPQRYVWEYESEIVGTVWVIIPYSYEKMYLAIVKFDNPFRAVQVCQAVDYYKKEVIFTFPYIDTGHPYVAIDKFRKEFKKYFV